MKIGNRLRDVLMKQSETLMLSPTKGLYMGEIYTFKAVTEEEFEGVRMELLKLIDKKSWAEELFKKLFKR